MTLQEMNNLLTLCAAPRVDVNAPLPLVVTPAGRRLAEEIDTRCCLCGDSVIFCEHEPSAEQIARWNAQTKPDPAVEEGIRRAFVSLGLADRLAESMKEDKSC